MKMTREEAIKVLGQMKDGFVEVHNGNPVMWEFSDYGVQAFDMAIEALKNERPKGHWVPYKHESCTYGKTNYICSECGHVGTKFKEGFCMCCGADMRGDNNDD